MVVWGCSVTGINLGIFAWYISRGIVGFQWYVSLIDDYMSYNSCRRGKYTGALMSAYGIKWMLLVDKLIESHLGQVEIWPANISLHDVTHEELQVCPVTSQKAGEARVWTGIIPFPFFLSRGITDP